ncbi:ABC transporter substrate-binding protein [Aeromicrobium sp.]|uniref:ABC transporter substrate-binding protein n=1 Tax=Aeromicrobium sp. TaxID=1871063 RepID=UPI002FC77BDF
MKRNLAVLATLSSFVFVAACGGSDSDGSQSAETPPGEAIKFSVLYPKTGPGPAPETLSGAEVAAKAINDAGGVAPKAGGDKRPIELVPCDADNSKNPSQPAGCAKEVIDKGVVLDVGKYTLSGDEVDVFAKEGVAMLGNSPFGQQDLTNDLSFPLGGAGASLVPGTAATLQSAGAKKVAYLSFDIPAARAASDFIKPILESPDDLVATTLLPLDPSADLTPFFAKLAAEKPDGIILGVSPGVTAAAVNGLRQAGFEGIFVATPYTLTKDSIKALGAEADKLLVTSNFEALSGSSVPKIKQFREEMKKYAPDADLNEFSLNSWLAVHLAAEVAAEVPTIDAAGFAKALNGRKVDLGVAPAFTLGKQDIYLPFPRVSRATVQNQKLKDGEIVSDGEWINLNDLAK